METKEIVAGINEIGDKIGEYKKTTELKISGLERTNQEMATAIDQLKKNQYKLGAGPFAERSTVDLINDEIGKHFNEIKELNRETPVKWKFENKAGNITGSSISLSGSLPNAPVQYGQQIITRPRRIVIRDLLGIINSTTGSYSYFSQPATGIGAGSVGFQAGQGNIKAQLDKNLTMNVVTTDYLAGYARISKQILNDLPSMQSFVGNDLVEDYRRAESAAFLPLLQAAATQYSPTATVTAEKIVQAIGDLLSRDYSPNGIITDAATWAKLINTKSSSMYGLPGGSGISVDSNGFIMFLGLPILVVNNINPGIVIVGDFTKAAIVQSEGLSIAFFEQDQDNVIRNLITARVEARVALAVQRPDAFDSFGAGTT